MSKRIWIAIGSAVVVAGAVGMWRRNRRVGTAFVNSVVNPFMLRRGLTGGARSELGTLEHLGRKSGILRRTPVRPVPTAHGFRIVVPLADESEWARNVLAAGHCQLEWRSNVYTLDEPRLVAAQECDDLAMPVRLAASLLGFRYMLLRVFASRPVAVATPDATEVVAVPTEAGRPADAHELSPVELSAP
jgi:deazaflavin-dependent oxidoreductase (nitroreductase family)